MVVNIEMAKFESHYSQNAYLNPENDSRKHPRKSCKKALFFTLRHQYVKGVVIDISRGGAYIATANIMSLGTKINFVIHRSKNRKSVRLGGWIVRSGGQGVGVSFDRRLDRERRFDLDRRTGLDRRKAGDCLNP